MLQGGPGNEREVSLMSAKCVRSALEAAGAEVYEVDVRGDDFVLREGTDLGFNVIHGTYGEDGGLQAELERRGVAYTGAGTGASRLAFDKIESKQRFVAAGVPTPGSETVRKGEEVTFKAPVVVKPPREGSSVGVHIVVDDAGVAAALEDVWSYGDEALVEVFVEGRELTMGVFDGTALPVVEIKPRGGFYDMNNKYPWMGGGGGSDYVCPAEIGEEESEKVQVAGLAAHVALGIEVYSRVDLLLDAAGEVYVLEVNTIPGMTESSLLPKSAAAAGFDFKVLCSRIAELSLKLRKPE